MTRVIAAGITLVFSAFCQSQSAESSTTQALLNEVRQLRQDIEAMTVASQRVQIALYTLQLQDSAVTRAIARMDAVSKQCAAQEAERQHLTAAVRDAEALAQQNGPSEDARRVAEGLPQLRRLLETKSAESMSCRESESQAEGQLRSERNKMTELQDRIAHLDEALAGFGREKR